MEKILNASLPIISLYWAERRVAQYFLQRVFSCYATPPKLDVRFLWNLPHLFVNIWSVHISFFIQKSHFFIREKYWVSLSVPQCTLVRVHCMYYSTMWKLYHARMHFDIWNCNGFTVSILLFYISQQEYQYFVLSINTL